MRTALTLLLVPLFLMMSFASYAGELVWRPLLDPTPLHQRWRNHLNRWSLRNQCFDRPTRWCRNTYSGNVHL